MKEKIFQYLGRSRFTVPVILAALVGIATGLIAVGFIELISLCQRLFFGEGTKILSFLGPYAVILIPAAGGILVGPLVTSLAPEAKGHGVPEVMKAIALRGGRIRPVVVVAKAMASALAIGSGASVGREGPIVQVGSAFGSSAAQFFKLKEWRVKNFVACGAAAGISAVFNAPIAGVMFALEVILRDFGARALSTVVIASVASSIVSHIFLGASPAFVVPVYRLWSPFEIFLYLGLGALSAFTALLFVSVLDASENLFDRWKFPNWLKPAAGGLGVGILGLYFPELFGSGLQTIEDALHGNLALGLLLALIFLKIFATSLSLGSGSSGGVFAPALFIGSVLGGSLGRLVYGRLPFPVAPPGAYALVGMASVFAGAAHAPVTAILIVFEMTGDYQMILPIMAAVVVSTSIAQLFRKESIYTIRLKRLGIDIEPLEGAALLSALQVRDAMTKDLKNVDLSGPLTETCFPEDPLNEAAQVLMDHGLAELPVVDSKNPQKVAGVLKSADVMKAYTQVAAKRDELLGRLREREFHASGTSQIRFALPLRSPLGGKAIKELGLPQGVVLTSLRRGNSVLIPQGSTVLKSRDKIWAIVLPPSEAEFREWLKKHNLKW